jgi:hypothetical protein
MDTPAGRRRKREDGGRRDGGDASGHRDAQGLRQGRKEWRRAEGSEDERLLGLRPQRGRAAGASDAAEVRAPEF